MSGHRVSQTEQLRHFNECLQRVADRLNEMEEWKKGDWSPELKEQILALSQKSEKLAVEILSRIEKLEAGLKP